MWMTNRWLLVVVVAIRLAMPAEAAFVVEADNDNDPVVGKAFDHFVSTSTGSGFQLSVTPSQAVGLSGNQSAFGNPDNVTGPDRYELFYTPGMDADNTAFFSGTYLGNSSANDGDGAGPLLPVYTNAPHFASGLPGGTSGMYNVYFTVPSTQNVNPLGSTITITNSGAPVVLNPVIMNDGFTGPDESAAGGFTGGANNRWLRLATVPLLSGETYSVVIEANANPPDLVSQRTHGVMWEYVGPLGGNEVEPNDSIATAQNIDALFTLDFNANVGNQTTNTSTVLPHAGIFGTGDNTFDNYSFTVANAGDIGIFDIDSTFAMDSHLRLYDAGGNQLTSNDDSFTGFGQGGSVSGFDSYLEYTFSAPGTYIVEVGSCCVDVVPPGASYELNVSVGADPFPPIAPIVLDNGSLRVEIRGDNGAIAAVQFGGSDFYNPGTPVSDWGMQVADQEGTFAKNGTDGATQISAIVTDAGDSAVVVANYAPGNGVDVEVTRTYSLVPGLDVLRVTTEFVNNGVDTVISYFDTLDPDQGEGQGTGFYTFNDVYPDLGGAAIVGQATETGGLSVAIGSLDSEATVASGLPFSIDNGFSLNNFFTVPFDGDGVYDDQGTHIGVRRFLGAGESFTFTYDQAYGLSAFEARGQFRAANVPEPGMVVLLAAGLSLVVPFLSRRRLYRQVG